MAFDAITYAAAKSAAKTYTDQVVAGLSKGMEYKGSVPTASDLPDAAASNKGWLYTVVEDGHEYVSDGTQWIDLNADLENKQDKLVSGTNIKTVNNTSLLGSGNIAVKTYQPFPNGTIRGTLEQVVNAVLAFPGRAQGMAYLGGISGSCVADLGLLNAECTVTFMTNGIAVLSLSSSNIYPYHWEYNTASSDLKWKQFITVPVADIDPTKTYTLQLANGAISWVETTWSN